MRKPWLIREYRWSYLLLVVIIGLLSVDLLLDNILYPILLAAALVPGIVYIAIVRASDAGKREPRGVIALYMILGILMIYPAIFIETLGMRVLVTFGLKLEFSYNILSILFWLLFASLIVAPVEELLKWSASIAGNLFHHENDEISDTVVYAVAVAGGFALYENYRYVFGAISSFSYSDALTLAVARSFTAIPLHLGVAMVMGYYLSIYFHHEKYKIPENRRKYQLFKAYLYPTIIHAIYDMIVFLIFDNFVIQVTMALILVFFLNFYVWKFLLAQNVLKFGNTEDND